MSAPAFAPPPRLRLNAGLVTGLVMMGIVALIAIFAPVFLSEKATMLSANRLRPPGPEFWLGTDSFGRDLFARALVATRLTVLMALGATAISVIMGVAIGCFVWLAPRPLREASLRTIDIVVAFPGLLSALVVAAILGPSATTLIIAIGLAGVANFARITANLGARISARDHVTTARLMGVPGHRIVRDHMIPNMAEPLLVLTATSFASTLIEISALSFIGLGVQAPAFDFGKLLNEGLAVIYTRPTEVIGPVVMIVFTAVSAMLVGDGLAAAASPRTTRALARAKALPPRRLPPRSDRLLDVENLRITTEAGAVLVDGVSLSLREGEILGIVGESGSGKSLTAMAIARLLPENLVVSADRLDFAGMDLRQPQAARDLATTMALIYQDPGSTFSPALRIGTQVTEVLRTHLGLSRARAEAALTDAFAKVHMTEPALRMRQCPHELSGGMRQRAMIAAALSVSPRLVIADEATTALDVTVQAEVLREIRRMRAETGASVLFISHDLGVVETLCDRVVVMHGGRVQEVLSAEDLRLHRTDHPYTRKLLAATPRIGRLKDAAAHG